MYCVSGIWVSLLSEGKLILIIEKRLKKNNENQQALFYMICISRKNK